MDWKSFIAHVVNSTAWPVAVISMIVLFRRQLATLLERINKFRAAGIDLEIGQKIEQAISAGDRLAQETQVVTPDAQDFNSRLLTLAETFPSAAVIEAYRDIEKQLLSLRIALNDKPNRAAIDVILELNKRGYLTRNAVDLFNSIRGVRNLSAHGKSAELTPSQAFEIVQQSSLLNEQLKQITTQLLTAKPISEGPSAAHP